MFRTVLTLDSKEKLSLLDLARFHQIVDKIPAIVKVTSRSNQRIEE